MRRKSEYRHPSTPETINHSVPVYASLGMKTMSDINNDKCMHLFYLRIRKAGDVRIEVENDAI